MSKDTNIKDIQELLEVSIRTFNTAINNPRFTTCEVREQLSATIRNLAESLYYLNGGSPISLEKK